jgi:DNA-binding transcriptional ArsR family regulator
MDGYQALARIHRTLGPPVRLRIVDVLSRQEACVCHLTAALGLRQPYVSQHLAALRDAGLVTDRRAGTLVYYRLRDERLAALLALARNIATADGEDRSMTFPPTPTGAVAGCPCPRCTPASAGRLELSSPDEHAIERMN